MGCIASAALRASGRGGTIPWGWSALGLLLALVAAALVVWWIRRLGRRIARQLRRRRPLRPRYPVVLAHGFMGFDHISIGGARHHYFRGVADALEREGYVVHRPRVAMTRSIAARAEELAAHLRELEAPRVNIVAHSMGGLDARFALAHLGAAAKVISLVTVGTPHRGTRLADLGSGIGGACLRGALDRVGLRVDGLEDLTTERMRAFNREVPDARNVAYGCVVARARRKRDLNPLLLPTYLWLREMEGDNDGVVTVASQRWGEVLREIEADHWAQIGWSRRFDAAELYAELLRELRGRGL